MDSAFANLQQSFVDEWCGAYIPVTPASNAASIRVARAAERVVVESLQFLVRQL